jgi:RNA polymerase sigma-70 factor, ECF subfamily
LSIKDSFSTGPSSDEALIARVARSDPSALEALYDRYAPMVLGISLKITGERATAEEVLQETFWQVWQQAPVYEAGQGSFTGWLFGLARGLALDTCHWKLSKK